MLATVVGAAAGMIVSAPLNFVLEAALGPDGRVPWTAAQTILIVVFKGAEGGMMGLGMGLGQWWVFRKYLKQSGGWVLATALAMFAQGAFRWSLPYDTPAGQVGVITALSFGVFLGLCQWFVLRGRVPFARSWIAISIAGWVAVLALEAATGGTGIESFLGMVLLAISMLVPFAVAGGGMVWLLRQTEHSSQAIAL